MIKKIFYLLLAIFSALCLFSCTPQASKPSEDAITILGKETDLAKSYMTKIFDLYRNTGKELNIVAIEDKDFETEAKKMFDSGKAPDILMHFHNSDLNNFDMNNFLDLSNESWVSDLTSSAKAYCTDSEGKLLGLPYWESSVSGCYYNKTILDDLGLEHPSSTQGEFDALCATLKKDFKKTPICWSANESWMFQFALDPVFADDNELLDKLNKNEISYKDIPQVKQMVEWIQNAAENGWFTSDYQNIGWNELPEKLASGKTVMTFIWDTWFYTDFKAYLNANPDSQYGIEDFELMPVFMNTVDGGTYEGGNLNMMMVNKNSDKAELALEFLRFCATPANYNETFRGIATVKCFTGMNTNIQSDMVTYAQKDIAAKERVSTASTKIIGYSATEMADVFKKLFKKSISTDKCIDLLDELRIFNAKAQGTPGF